MQWSKLFFAMAFTISVVSVLPALWPAADELGVDHTFHLSRFKLLASRGFCDYEELGGIGFQLVTPPFMLAFYPLILLLGPRVAYILLQATLLALPLLVGRKLGVDYGPVMAAIYFPFSLFIFSIFGRLLEMAANVFFLLLFFYLESEPRLLWSSVLFFLGFSAHPPTALLYSIPILIRVHEEGLYRHLLPWAAIGLAWLPVYVPKVFEVTAMVLPRLAWGRVRAISLLNEAMPSVSLLAVIILVGAALFLTRLTKGRHYFLIPIVLGLLSAAFIFLGIDILEKIPAVNQMTPFTPLAMLAAVLWMNDRGLWTKLSYVLLPVVVATHIVFLANARIDFSEFDFVEGPVVLVSDCSRVDGTIECEPESMTRLKLSNYLAGRGVPSPFCTTWEYSDPQWYFYDPASCGELNESLEYVILDAENNAWAADCNGSRLVEGHYVVPT